MRITKTVEELFPKGYTPQSHQPAIIQQIIDAINSGEKYIIVEAPTGSGKSFIAKTVANATPAVDAVYERMIRSYEAYSESNADVMRSMPAHGAFVLTTTKQLQNQYEKQFDDGQVLKGKGNYQCAVDEQFSVDIAPCTIASGMRKKCWSEDVCPYYNRRNQTLISQFGILNYSKFFKLPEPVKKRSILICDECSELESEFVSAFSCKITYKRLAALKIDYPKLIDDNHDRAYAWLAGLYEIVAKMLEENRSTRYVEIKKWDTAKQVVLTELRESIRNVLNTWQGVKYVIERDGDRAEFIPYKVAPLTRALFDYADHVILMSATIVNHRNFAKTLGIQQYKYIEASSAFDPKKSPIYCSGKYPLSHAKMSEYLPKVLDQVVQLSKHHANEKGIIHTHSFEITQAVQRRLNTPRFLFREEGSKNEDILNEHILRKDPTVLVSPSLTMGVDLKGELGKWQVIIKLPFPSLGSKRVKMLFEEDKEWYTAQMLKVLVQACGRCTRSASDESVTYILDGNIIRVLKDNQRILPKHFVDRVV